MPGLKAMIIIVLCKKFFSRGVMGETIDLGGMGAQDFRFPASTGEPFAGHFLA
jgi:hypothetical protein